MGAYLLVDLGDVVLKLLLGRGGGGRHGRGSDRVENTRGGGLVLLCSTRASLRVRLRAQDSLRSSAVTCGRRETVQVGAREGQLTWDWKSWLKRVCARRGSEWGVRVE